MERIAISKFKATCLAVLEKVGKTRRPVLVTRFGEPEAEIVPASPPERPSDWLGAMKGTVRIHDEIVSPAGDEEDWEVLKDGSGS